MKDSGKKRILRHETGQAEWEKETRRKRYRRRKAQRHSIPGETLEVNFKVGRRRPF